MHKPNTQKNYLRIIGGKWRGRKLAIADVDGLRPTGDRIRETLFNWLTPYLLGANCLDCFAGSGALGLECLSRGAEAAWMIENNPTASATLVQHLQQLDGHNGYSIQHNCLEWLAQKTLDKRSINIAFIDPPFTQDLWDTAIQQLEHSHLLADEALIYIETPNHVSLNIPSHWQPHRNKQSGQVRYQLFVHSLPRGEQ